MKRPNNRRIWITGMLVLFVWAALFLLWINFAKAMLDDQSFLRTTIQQALSLINPNAITGTPQTFSAAICAIGPDPDCLAQPTLVSTSDGLWAYHVMRGVYFEYPSDWRLEQLAGLETKTVFFKPPPNSFEELNMKGAYLTVRDGALSTDFPTTDLSFWDRQISLPGFEGRESLGQDPDPLSLMYFLQVSLYHADRQQMIYLGTSLEHDETDQLTKNSKIAEEKFSKFQHIVESIKVWDE